ncbi:hypothetical protein [Amaricoccus tamworthensis]|uniref:hypothetical protein n=1 Tax=Amaricoccus tamworthensis TaxID=57002 RepID=UPI003C79899B
MSCEHDCDRPPRFPMEIYNRPGLGRFRYRIGDYATMRAHMLDRLVKTPELAGWTHLGADDPGIALLEGTALVGDILSFYQEVYANETRLPTAVWQDSLFDLVALTGYRPAPGLGGHAVFALSVKERVTVPAGFAFQAQLEGFDKPSDFESDAAIEAFPGLNAFHFYRRRKGPQPVKGKTSLDILRLGNSTRLERRLEHGIEAGDRILLRSGPHDPYEILTVAEVSEHLDRVTLHLDGAVRENHPAEVSAFRIGRTFRHFGADAPRQFSTFREDPPLSRIHSSDFLRRTKGTTRGRPNYSALGRRQMPLDSEIDDLSPGSRVICTGRVTGPVARDFVLLRRIEKVVPRDVVWAANSAPVTLLLLNRRLGSVRDADEAVVEGVYAEALNIAGFDKPVGEAGVTAVLKTGAVASEEIAEMAMLDMSGFLPAMQEALFTGYLDDGPEAAEPEMQDIRRLRFHEVLGETMVLGAPPVQKPSAADGRVNFFGTREEARSLAGRRILLAGGGEAPQDIVVAAEQPELEAAKGPTGDRRMWPIVLGTAPQEGPGGFSETDPTVTVYGNLVAASEGASQSGAVIGSGNAAEIFQTFVLPKAPLTFHADAGISPPWRAALEIRVGGRLWQAVDTFFDRAATAQVYVLRRVDGQDVVQFGDGINGARLPSGQGNVTADYRVGQGAHGDLAVDQEPKGKTRLKPLTSVEMPGPATGGCDPETMDTARLAAPGRMQGLGRIVSLADYETEALAIPGVLKAGAVFARTGDRPGLSVTVLTADESPEALGAVAAALRHADRCRGAGRHALEVIGGRRRYLSLSLVIGTDPAFRATDIEAAVADALGVLPLEGDAGSAPGLFSLSARGFGQDVHVSQAIAAAQSVEGVVHVTPKAFVRLPADEDDPARIALPKTDRVHARILAGVSEVLALSSAHLVLSLSSAQTDAECV